MWQGPQVPLLIGKEDIRGVHVSYTPEVRRIPRHLTGCELRLYATEALAVEAYTFYAEAYGAPVPARVFRCDDHGSCANGALVDTRPWLMPPPRQEVQQRPSAAASQHALVATSAVAATQFQ